MSRLFLNSLLHSLMCSLCLDETFRMSVDEVLIFASVTHVNIKAHLPSPVSIPVALLA